MTQPTIFSVQQKIVIADVGGVTVTTPTLTSDGTYVREIRITGVADANNTSPPLVFTLRLASSTNTNILITTPVNTF